jgi:hypothetical protein
MPPQPCGFPFQAPPLNTAVEGFDLQLPSAVACAARAFAAITATPPPRASVPASTPPREPDRTGSISGTMEHLVEKGDTEGLWHHYVNWIIHERNLKTSNKQMISPPFTLPLNGINEEVSFKLVVYAKVTYLSKGGGSWKKARAKGKIEMKCVHPLDGKDAFVEFSFMVGSNDPSKQQLARGPVNNNFAVMATAGLPQKDEEWIFSESVDETHRKFIVSVKVENLRSTGGKNELCQEERRIDPMANYKAMSFFEMCEYYRANGINEEQLKEYWSNLEKA